VCAFYFSCWICFAFLFYFVFWNRIDFFFVLSPTFCVYISIVVSFVLVYDCLILYIYLYSTTPPPLPSSHKNNNRWHTRDSKSHDTPQLSTRQSILLLLLERINKRYTSNNSNNTNITNTWRNDGTTWVLLEYYATIFSSLLLPLLMPLIVGFVRKLKRCKKLKAGEIWGEKDSDEEGEKKEKWRVSVEIRLLCIGWRFLHSCLRDVEGYVELNAKKICFMPQKVSKIRRQSYQIRKRSGHTLFFEVY